MINIETLRKNGNRVRVMSYRYSIAHNRKLIPTSAFRALGMQNLINPKGGSLEVSVTNPSGKTNRVIVQCSPKDSFNRKVGIKLALERLGYNDPNGNV